MTALGVATPPTKPTRPANEHLAPSGIIEKVPVSSAWKLTIVAVAIVSNAALLIAQQAAFRLLAPVIGSSVETWSAIIGVFLLGIAIGNHYAGKLADRFSAVSLISGSLAAGAISMLLMPVIADNLAGSIAFGQLSLSVQIFTGAFFVCLIPGIVLSLVTPPSIRSVVSDPREIGSVAGRIFAWGTFGSLAGNYLAGFVLLALFGVRVITSMTAASLIVLAVATFIGGRRHVINQKRTPQLSDDTVNTKEDQSTADLDRQWYRKALLIVFACSFVTGAVEGAAFRILAPLVGVSMFLSAGVVGVILAGMSFGNALGGNLATRFGTHQVLRKSLIACAVATLAIAPFWKFAVSSGIFKQMSLIPQILVWSFTLFLLPAIAFGTITPQVIRLSVRSVKNSGKISGQLYAWSTVGCIVGILVAAWFSIETFGAIRTTILCGMIPVALALLSGKAAGAGTMKATEDASPTTSAGTDPRMIPAALLVAAVALLLVCKSPYDRESRYFSLAVDDDVPDGREVKVLVLDRLVHSAIDLDDPSFLHYPHERIQGDFTRAAAKDARAAGRTPRILVIGGGGYSFPRWVESQSDLHDVIIDVVEIDPAVTEIAHDLLGLSRNTRINSIHMDGRQYVKGAPAASYDLVIQDAVNDFSVPYHLMTAEYNALIQRLLQPDGVYLLTVIDAMESGRFLASAVRTVQSSFGETHLLAPPETHKNLDRSVYVIGGRFPATPTGVSDAQKESQASTTWWKDRSYAHIFTNHEVVSLLERRGDSSPILTDDYAPVDTLMTSHFLERGK
jgi:spermidine synthase/MFS family permease